jgi:hypothetical protein
MPIYPYKCVNGHITEYQCCLNVYTGDAQNCEFCDELAERIITAPLLVKAAQDVCYDSPIDGRPITSWDARREDMKRSNCRPYDPEMKTDAARFRKEQDAALDQSIETHVERAIEKMPTAKRGKLMSELTAQGVGVEYVRSTIGGT